MKRNNLAKLRIRTILMGLILLSLPTVAVSTPVQVWHTVSGNSVTGSLDKVEGGMVYLLVNGKPVHIQTAKLAPEDRIVALMAQYVHYASDGTPIGLDCEAPEFARKAYFDWNVQLAEAAGKRSFKFAPMGEICELPSIPTSVLSIGVLKTTFYDELSNPQERWYMIRHRSDVEQMRNGNFTTTFWDDDHAVSVYFGRDVVQEIYALPEHSRENGYGPWVYFVKGKLGITAGKYGDDKGILVGNLQTNAQSFPLSDAVREKLETMTSENWEAVRDELLGR